MVATEVRDKGKANSNILPLVFTKSILSKRASKRGMEEDRREGPHSREHHARGTRNTIRGRTPPPFRASRKPYNERYSGRTSENSFQTGSKRG